MRSRANLSASSARGSQAAIAAAISSCVTRRPARIEIELIELLRVVAQRAVAARGDVGNDGAHRRFDVGGCLALGVEEGAKFSAKSAARVSRRMAIVMPCALPCSDA